MRSFLTRRRQKYLDILSSTVVWGAAFLAVVLGFIILVPQWRERTKEMLTKSNRQVLTSIYGDLTGEGDWVSIFKVIQGDSIVIEVYNSDEKRTPLNIRTRIVFTERRDAIISFRGTPTNLILTDLDGDKTLELVVPVYDEDLVPRLHVFKYDSSKQSFEKVPPGSMTLNL